jgi:hypothetical protein
MNMYSSKTNQTKNKEKKMESGKKALMFKYCLSFEIKSLLVTGSQLVLMESWISPISWTYMEKTTSSSSLTFHFGQFYAQGNK